MKLFQKYSLTKRVFILFALTIAVSLSTSLIFYYATFHSIKNEKIRNMENLSRNLAQNTEDIAASVMLISETVSTTPYTHSILTETNPAQKVSQQQFLNRLITRLIKSSSHVHNILLIDNRETIYSFSSFDYSLADKLNQQYQILSLGSFPDGFTGALYLSGTSTAYYAYIQGIYKDNDIAKEKIGACVIICYCDPLNTLCGNAASAETMFAVLDSENQILACNLEKASAVLALSEADPDRHLILRSQPSSLTGWSLFCSVPYNKLYAELQPVRQLAVLLILIPFLAFALLACQISASVASPLTKIADYLQKDSYYILHHRLEAKGSAEIDTLSSGINQMLAEINELTHTILQNQAKLYEIELSKNQAQLLALQTQINPHFLYNTLSSIQGMAYQNKNAEICTAVTALSYMMRYNFRGDSMTLVREEFLCIEKYLQIISLRFQNCFEFRLRMDDKAADCRMPRFLLQPLVENAITHGLEPCRPKKGILALTASLMPDSILHLECADDGAGIPPGELEKLRLEIENAFAAPDSQRGKRSGIGLSNIHMRIRLIYGAPFGLSIFSSAKGTTVCADFPADTALV